MPVTPACDSASRTSSSLNGRMIAVISFMLALLWILRSRDREARNSEPRGRASERLADAENPGYPTEVFAFGIRVDVFISVGVVIAERNGNAVGKVLGHADLPVGVVGGAEVLDA